jgi:peptide-methionine (S)-S-oxide reductase
MADLETVVLGGGCFWCLEAVFDRIQGVAAVESGYMGGSADQATYQAVCSGKTGHAEVVRVRFDPAQITFAELLDVFFALHDPTTLNRQGNDAGTQYRSVIFYASDEQRRAAEAKIAELSAARAFAAPIVTAVEPAGAFHIAEDYHQEYFANNPRQPYCQMVVAPKVRKAMEKFGDKMASSR